MSTARPVSTELAFDVGDVPEGWALATLGEISEIVGGGTPRTSERDYFSDDGYPWLTPADLSGYQGIYISRGKRGLSEKGLKSCSATLMPKGSVLMSSRAPIGYVAVAANPICTNQGFKSFVCHQNIHPEYVYYWLRFVRPQLEQMGSGSTFSEISGGRASEIPIALAPTPEQKRIVTKVQELLARLNAPRERLQQVPTILKRLRQAVLDSACSGRLTADWRQNGSPQPQDLQIEAGEKHLPPIAEEELLFETPPSWHWSRLGSLAILINGDRGKNYPKRSEYVPKGIPFINAGHIQPDGSLSGETMNYLTREKYGSLRSGKIRTGDLLYCLRGTLGKVALVEPYREGAIASSLVIIRLTHTLDRHFAFYFLTSSYGKILVDRFDNGSAQPNLAAESVRRYVVPLPPIAEQQEIARRVEGVFSLADAIEMRLAAATARADKLTQAILVKAFRGELVPTEAELARRECRSYEPASVLLERLNAMIQPTPNRPRRPREKGGKK